MINQLKTAVLLGLLTALLLWAGQALGGYGGLTIAFIFVLLMNGIMYFFSDKLVLMMYRAKEVKASQAPRLYKLIKEICHVAGLPMPKVYIIPTETPNAFATGRNPQHAAIACTEGILKLLNDDELKGVLAHEASHIKNRDILIATIASTIAGVISYLAMMARWAALFGGYDGRDNNRGNAFELIALSILTPLIAVIIQLAISRSREYLADETGARLAKNSKGLSGALLKLEKGVKHNPLNFGNQSTANLFIVNPFKANFLLGLLSTHPPVQERVKRLKEMKV